MTIDMYTVYTYLSVAYMNVSVDVVSVSLYIICVCHAAE